MRLAGALLALLMIFLMLAAGCAPGPERQAPGTTGHETKRDPGAGEMSVEQIAESQSGPDERRVVVAGSAAELSAATGLQVPDAGEGLYVSAHAGERPTGGYRVSLSGMAAGKVRVTIREPGSEDIVTQALTQPYAVAVVRYESEQLPETGEPQFVNAKGEPLGWPVRRVGENKD
jgi:hypothetical protein